MNILYLHINKLRNQIIFNLHRLVPLLVLLLALLFQLTDNVGRSVIVTSWGIYSFLYTGPRC